ncbi:MAG: hydantoinase/oxoprolinase family protein, partial [Halobacteria archaeon]|nr:hydantoinase/oxoprolinase family protein [Halobacteria archaeon]
LGGDTRITDEGLTRNREGDAAAFGGPYPTLTDALHVVGDVSEGDGSRAYGAVEGLAGEVEDTARNALEEYTSQVADAVSETAGTLEEPPREVVVGGALAPYLAPRIGSRLEGFDEVTVPEHSGVAGAVGCAAARVSVTTDVRIDSPRGEMTVGSVGAEKVERVDKGRRFSDEEVEELVRDEARRAAERAGGERDDEAPTEVLELGRFNVVEGSRVVGEVVDATAQVEPGYRRLSGGDEVNE